MNGRSISTPSTASATRTTASERGLATTQKPRQVVESMARFFDQENANVHRGVYLLAERATEPS